MAAIAVETEVWSAVNSMVLNGNKSKEIVIPFGRTGAGIAPKLIDNTVVEQVTSFKLLGCIINNQLLWQDHIDCIYTKASWGLYFLCLLRRAGVKSHNIVQVATLSPLQFAPFWNMHVQPGTPASLGNSQKSLNPFNGRLCALLPQTCHTGKC